MVKNHVPCIARSVLTLVACGRLALGLSGTAAAQTKPSVRDLGGDTPSSALYVGNSIFYVSVPQAHLALSP